MRASEGIKFHYRSGVGTTSTEVKGQLRHIVSFKLLKLPVHHLNSKEEQTNTHSDEESVVDLVISIHVQHQLRIFAISIHVQEGCQIVTATIYWVTI